MDAILHIADALKEACADVIATWQAAQEPCVPKTPTAVTATHRTMGQEWDASQARSIEHAEDDVHTWYACSPEKASGLQAASRAMHGMLPARRSGCSPTAGHALDVQRSWLSRYGSHAVPSRFIQSCFAADLLIILMNRFLHQQGDLIEL